VTRLPDARPVVCLVTDRRRLSPHTAEADACAHLIEQVAAAARAGIHLVQVREPDLTDAALYALVTRCLIAAAGTPCRVLVNDRPDVALASRSHGVHFRADGYPARRIRDIAPDTFIIGRSVHDAREAAEIREEGSVDYLLFGTVFPTASKPPGHAAAGVAGLKAAVEAGGSLPVLGIGGMTAGRAADVARSGAAGLAGIGLFLETDAAALGQTVRAVQRSFDSSSVFH